MSITGIDNYFHGLQFREEQGSLLKNVKPIKIDFPFLENKEYTVIKPEKKMISDTFQYALMYSHTLVFKVNTLDTICSASEEYVVKIVDQCNANYTGKIFPNSLTIYKPTSGSFFESKCFIKNGILVELGDKIEPGQPVGLSGYSGQIDSEYLFFS